MENKIVAEALYNHWKSSSYELKRQPVFDEADINLRRVFLSQAEAVTEALINNGLIIDEIITEA